MDIPDARSASDSKRLAEVELVERELEPEAMEISGEQGHLEMGKEVLIGKEHNLRVFSIPELEIVTDDFNSLKTMGRGFKSAVVKGTIMHPKEKGIPTVVEIELVKVSSCKLQLLGGSQHPNLVQLLGYCDVDWYAGVGQCLLVHEYMSNGSLECHLFNSNLTTLPWTTRLEIILGAAQGLAYLHEGLDRQVIYQYFKSSNVLLDEYFKPKLPYYGLAKKGATDDYQTSRVVARTSGYTAPEYIDTGHLSVESDVYSFGVVLYEILTGRRVLDRNLPMEDQLLLEWVKQHPADSKEFRTIIDPRLKNQYSLSAARKIAKLADTCLNNYPRYRPRMSQVVKILKQVMEESIDESSLEKRRSKSSASANLVALNKHSDQMGVMDTSRRMEDPKSRGEEDSEFMQLQVPQYSDPRQLEGPSTISRHFSILHVVDLSYTGIKSLPQSISRLVALKKLYLRSCEFLMELPPEIGELKNLEVLDLEGTEIVCLPKEIAKLVNLMCLKVSFYGYANQTVIPRKVLPNLSRLNELIIDVTPYGEWWDVEVEDIIDDLFGLFELRTLKLHLPAAKLLEDLRLVLPSLENFRFTVGFQEEHFISRLPQNVEQEFNNWEKLEKGLKYINGSHIPNEIKELVKQANVLFLQRHWTAESLSEFGRENLNELKFCLVMECNEFRTIIDFPNYVYGSIVLGSLENLIIRYMKNMESIWKGPVGTGCLSSLKSLSLQTCPNLTTLFTFDLLITLTNLEELIVEDCPKIESLVSLKSSSSKSGLFLRSLKKISLLDLPELVSISCGLRIAPNLERMVIFYCPKLEKLSAMEVSSIDLKVIKGEKEWWDALKWYESDLSTEHEDYLARLFIPLRRNGDLMAQLTKD